MSSFNSMPPMTGGAPSDAMALNPNTQFKTFDQQDLTFDDAGLLDPNVNGGSLAPLPFTPTYDFDPFNPAFEDPFSFPATGPYGQSAGFNSAAAGLAQTANNPQVAPAASSSVPPGSSSTRPIIPGTAGARPPHPNLHHHHHQNFQLHRTTHHRPSHTHTHTHPGNTHDDASSPQELDDKLLGFSAPVHKAHLVDDSTGQIADVGMAAELYGMFFVAEDVFAPTPTTEGTNNNPSVGNPNPATAPSGATPATSATTTTMASTPAPEAQSQPQHPPGPKPLELTCYRRNLWQCSGTMTLPRHSTHLLTSDGTRHPIISLAATISASESIDNKPTEIISIPWKSASAAAANAPNTEGAEGKEDAGGSKSAQAPPRVGLDVASGETSVGEDGGIGVTVQVAWKRLQFKHATANNGRRKGLQQHYVVRIGLVARFDSAGDGGGAGGNFGGRDGGEWIKVAEISSGPVIVRGRSPRNFDSRRDVPLTGSTGTAAAGGSGGGGPSGKERRGTVGSAQGSDGRGSAVPSELSLGGGRYGSVAGGVQQQQPNDWTMPGVYGPQSSTPAPPNQQQQQHPNKKIALSPRLTGLSNRPPIPSWGSMQQNPQKSPANRPLPINLSLSEDERSSPNRNSDMAPSPQFSATRAGGHGGGGAGAGAGGGGGVAAGGGGTSLLGGPNSPVESADLLYEYFPLSLDDWSPPVDAIYRPHVVHHTVVPPDVRAEETRNKSKRYFAAD